jgi:glycosyltransferase involved in cell wall biosynthesis
MRILLVNSLSPGYGSTYRARAIYQVIKKLGYPIIYIESNSDLKAEDVISIPQKDNLIGYVLGSLRRAYYCLKTKYDLCIIQKFTPLTVFAILVVKIRGKKLIVDWDDLDHLFQATAIRKIITKFIEENLHRYVEVITTHSEYIKKFAQSIKVKKIYYLPQVIDTSLFDPNLYEKEALKRKLGLKDFIVLGYVGTLTEGGARDLDVIIQVVSEVSQKIENVYFLLVGGGPLIKKYEKMIKESNIKNFRITGLVPQSKVSEYISCMDICLIYMRDDLGNVMRVSLKLLEYLAMNKKVVGYLVGDTKDKLGKYCELVKPDVDSFTSKIMEFLKVSETSSNNIQSREYIVSNYSFTTMKEQLYKFFYEELK